ncbi:hypothetical protein [Prochlorococcus marinus]|uniref:Uncharacterized protein n=1 Tax=Prochlorococcus marinus str. PAC1 TaxID=59924 RepID=A0A0A2BYW0_PROMR|nr:hypothetical protein [Prochlorococcus marinus]KGG19281.1 hypothetical protein EV03_1661 [Prochlorococcus marinus str. PAC1]
MKKIPSNSQDPNLPPKVAKLIHDVNEDCERAKEHLEKIKKYTLRRDIDLKDALTGLSELQRICYEDVKGADEWSVKSLDELVGRPIYELREMVRCQIEDPPAKSFVYFDKIHEMILKVLDSIRTFKFSFLKQKRDQLDNLFRLPDADTD